MSDAPNTVPLVFHDWQPLRTAILALEERMMTRDPQFILDHWDCKYVDARIDMRTGAVYLKPGNVP